MTPTTETEPAPTPPPATRWTPQNVFGCMCIIAAVVVSIVMGMPDIANMTPTQIASATHTAAIGQKLSTALWGLGTSMVAFAPAIPSPLSGKRAGPTSAVIAGLLIAVLGFTDGCTNHYQRLHWSVTDGDSGPSSCVVTFTDQDGRRVARFTANKCPDELIRTPPTNP